MVAGVILGLGLGAVRLSSAESPADELFAIGLTIVEIAAVLLLEWLASGLRNSENLWIPLHASESEALATRDAAAADLARWKTLLQEINQRVVGAKGERLGGFSSQHRAEAQLLSQGRSEPGNEHSRSD